MGHAPPTRKRRSIRFWVRSLCACSANLPFARHQGRTEGALGLLVTGLILGLERKLTLSCPEGQCGDCPPLSLGTRTNYGWNRLGLIADFLLFRLGLLLGCGEG